MNTEEIERLLAKFEEQVYQALKAAFELTRGEVDASALAEAIASEDEAAITTALEIAATSLELQADSGLSDIFAGLFEAAFIVAATTLGHPSYNPDRLAFVVRDNLRFQIARELAAKTTTAALRSIETMRTNAESPRAIASHLVQSIGLSDGQKRSIDTFRSVLVRGQRRNTTYFPAGQLRRLNASQRSILRSVIPNEVTDDDVQRLTSQQRLIMENHRAQTTARTATYKLSNASQQSAWEQLDRDRQIDGYKRYWIHAGDERVRHTHRTIPGINAAGRGLQEPFHTPLGPTHAPPLEINCRCHVELRRPSP